MHQTSKNWLLKGLTVIWLSIFFVIVTAQAADVNPSSSKTTNKNTKSVPTPAPAAVETPKETTKEAPINLSLDKNEVDRVVAIVSREVITAKDLKDRTELVIRQLTEAKRPLPTNDILVRQVLEKLIEESVIYQEATYANFKISDLEYDAIYNNVLKQKNMTESEFKNSLEKTGQSYDKFRELLRRDIVITRFRERMVDSRVKIMDSEVNDYILSRLTMNNSGSTSSSNASANTNTPEMLYISQIVVPIKDSDTRQEQNAAKAKAEEIFKNLQNEKDFINYVNRLVAVDKNLKVQDLGYRTLDRLPQIFIDATAKLQPGQLAPTILKTSAGFHILKLLDRKGGKNAVQEEKTPEVTLGQSIQIEQAEVRHLMLIKKAGVNDVDLERKLRLYKSQVESKTADFGELAKKFSEDKETASNLGYIGWLSVGQSLPEFDIAIKNTKSGAITEPFETTYGWHLLQVINKQSKEITFNQQKEYARNALRQERLDQAYSDWTRELRDNATVEYRAPFAAEK